MEIIYPERGYMSKECGMNGIAFDESLNSLSYAGRAKSATEGDASVK